MLLVKFLGFLEELFAEPEICNLEHIIIHKYIFWFDISMDNIELIEILEGVEDLLEVFQYLLFFPNPTITVEYPEVIIQILVIAILQDQVDPVVLSVAHHVLYLYDVGVVS